MPSQERKPQTERTRRATKSETRERMLDGPDAAHAIASEVVSITLRAGATGHRWDLLTKT